LIKDVVLFCFKRVLSWWDKDNKDDMIAAFGD